MQTHTSTDTPSIQSLRRVPRNGGFTLIELMIAVAVVAILATVALPSYSEQMVRGRLTEAAMGLASMQFRMEQYYQDQRTYVGGPCATASKVGTFSLSCSAASDDGYTLLATGSGTTSGFAYSVDNLNHQRTVALPASWGGVSGDGYTCWVMRRGSTC